MNEGPGMNEGRSAIQVHPVFKAGDESADKAGTPWWIAAHSSELSNSKPLASFCADESVVLFRDAQGTARALENRCPHRRVPLSLGRVLDNGMLHAATTAGPSKVAVASAKTYRTC